MAELIGLSPASSRTMAWCDVFGAGVLEQIAGGAGLDRGDHMGLVAEDADDHRLGVRRMRRSQRMTSMPLPSGNCRSASSTVGWLVAAQPGQRAAHVGAGRGELQVGHRLDDAGQALARDRVVFEQQDSVHGRHVHR